MGYWQVDGDGAVLLSAGMIFPLRRMGWMVLLAVALAGCAERKQIAPKAPVKTQVALEDLAAAEKLKQAIIAAAKQDLNRQPEWDDTVESLALRYAHALKMRFPYPEAGALAREAVERGCRSPFVRYMLLRHKLVLKDRVDESLAREGLAISDELEAGGYPAVVRSNGSLRAYLTWHKAFGRDEWDTLIRLRNRFWVATMDAVADPQIPEWMVRMLVSELSYQWSPSKDNVQVDEQIDGVYAERYGDSAGIHYLRGELAVRRAWRARGGGYANTVTEDGWRVFREQLDIALIELERAWELDPSEVAVAGEMIKVCKGLGLGREKMERWFQRGLASGGEPSTLSLNKHDYLAGRWHGSMEEQLAFSRECLGNAAYGWRASLLLWETHEEHRRFGKLPIAYFAEREVWSDIKSSFTAYLAFNPESAFYRMHYAYHAWLAKDWPILEEQLALLDEARADWDEIGGEAVYVKMKAAAKAHSVGQ